MLAVRPASLPWTKRWAVVLRLAWYPAAAGALAIMAGAVPGYVYDAPIGVFRARLTLEPRTLIVILRRLSCLISFLSAAISLGFSGVLFVKKSDQPMGLFLSIYL